MKKKIIISVFVLVLLVAAYFLFRKDKKSVLPTNGNTGIGGSLNANANAAAALDVYHTPFKLGSGNIAGSLDNQAIKKIQEALNLKYKANLLVDGKFGPKTLAVLLANKIGGLIYWKQYIELTGDTLVVNGKDVTESTVTINPFTWISEYFK